MTTAGLSDIENALSARTNLAEENKQLIELLALARKAERLVEVRIVPASPVAIMVGCSGEPAGRRKGDGVSRLAADWRGYYGHNLVNQYIAGRVVIPDSQGTGDILSALFIAMG